MTTLEYGWYRCPNCGNRTPALDESGDQPDCPDCPGAAAPADPLEPETAVTPDTTAPDPDDAASGWPPNG